MSTITLIPCGAKKLEVEAPAAQLYQGSMFQQGLKAAATFGDPVYIVSALHGLVKPTKKLKPYDVKMGDAGEIKTITLAKQFQRLKQTGITSVRCFLPRAYLDRVVGICSAQGIQVVNMYDLCQGRRGIGCQKHVLKLVIDGALQDGAGK